MEFTVRELKVPLFCFHNDQSIKPGFQAIAN